MPTGQELLRAVDRLGGRARLAVVARVLEGRSREAFAGRLGISVEAGDVMLLRALAELEAAAGGGRVPPPAEGLEDAQERATAWALGRAVDGEAVGTHGLERPLALCRALREPPEVKAALVLPPPPPPTMGERARRLAWLVAVVVAAILYSKYWSS